MKGGRDALNDVSKDKIMTKALKALMKKRPNSAEFVIMHALWRISRGKRPSWCRLDGCGSTLVNPANVLFVAIDMEDHSGGGGRDYRSIEEKALSRGFRAEDIHFLNKRTTKSLVGRLPRVSLVRRPDFYDEDDP